MLAPETDMPSFLSGDAQRVDGSYELFADDELPVPERYF